MMNETGLDVLQETWSSKQLSAEIRNKISAIKALTSEESHLLHSYREAWPKALPPQVHLSAATRISLDETLKTSVTNYGELDENGLFELDGANNKVDSARTLLQITHQNKYVTQYTPLLDTMDDMAGTEVTSAEFAGKLSAVEAALVNHTESSSAEEEQWLNDTIHNRILPQINTVEQKLHAEGKLYLNYPPLRILKRIANGFIGLANGEKYETRTNQGIETRNMKESLARMKEQDVKPDSAIAVVSEQEESAFTSSKVVV